MGKSRIAATHRSPRDESPWRQIAFQVILRALTDACSRDPKQQRAKRDALAWLNSPDAKALAGALGLCWPGQITEQDLATRVRRKSGQGAP